MEDPEKVSKPEKELVYADDDDDEGELDWKKNGPPTTEAPTSSRPDDESLSEFDPVDQYPVREIKFLLPGFKQPLQFNPLVSFIGFVCLWGLSIWSMLDPDGAADILIEGRAETTRAFTWLFQGAKVTFFFFLIFIAYRFGHVKLGEKDEEPEFSTSSYFAMIFSAGVAVGLFVFGVSEPLYHRTDNFFAASGYRSQDEIDMMAINLTVVNWGINAWASYLVVAVTMGLAGYRFNLPMTFRSCFYPILGDYTWGWIGDVIDGFTIVVTVTGVCTSLGLGAIQIVDGYEYLGWLTKGTAEERELAQTLTIWVITGVATASVISGVGLGIKYLSLTAYLLGMALLFLVFVMDDTKHQLNLIVQETGYYIQYSIWVLNFWTDAYAQVEEGQGRATDDNSGAGWWMNGWLIFYLAWWISWSAFVGLFIARISRGRTLFEVIAYSFVAPILYCIVWFCVWGGTGLRQARQADEMAKLGGTVYGDENYFVSTEYNYCFDVPQEDIVNKTEEGTEVLFHNQMLGVTPVCRFNSSEAGFAPYHVLSSFTFPESFPDSSGFGPTLCVIFVVALSIYFATSSDSGSLVVDHLSTNGRIHHHWFQRSFWALTEGAVATALLSSGGSSALGAIQAGSIICGLPFTVFLCYMLQSCYCFALQAEKNDGVDAYMFPEQKEFRFPIYGGIFNIFEYIASFGSVHEERVDKGMDMPTSFQVTEFMKGVFVPFFPLWQAMEAAYPENPTSNKATAAFYGIVYYTWIAIFACLGSYPGLKGWGWLFFFTCALFLGSIRNGFRYKYNLRSNEVADALCSLFFWPQVIAQMRDFAVDNELPWNKES